MSLQHSSHLEKRLDELAKRLRQKARGVPPGVEREELLRKAQAAEAVRNTQPQPTQPAPKGKTRTRPAPKRAAKIKRVRD